MCFWKVFWYHDHDAWTLSLDIVIITVVLIVCSKENSSSLNWVCVDSRSLGPACQGPVWLESAKCLAGLSKEGMPSHVLSTATVRGGYCTFLRPSTAQQSNIEPMSPVDQGVIPIIINITTKPTKVVKFRQGRHPQFIILIPTLNDLGILIVP